MTSSNLRADSQTVLVADASVVINLNATLCAAEILRALSVRLVVTDNACVELSAGARNGHRDAEALEILFGLGLAHQVTLLDAGLKVYESLIDGTTLATLDDGEAATIGYAVQTGSAALIDERKARSICANSFPALVVVSTVDLLLHDHVVAKLGSARQAEALMNALTGARMRVPPEHLTAVTKMIGTERAAMCFSLPLSARRSSDR